MNATLIKSQNEALSLALDKVRPNPRNPRKIIDKEFIKALAGSIKAVGLIQPIVVREVEGGYEIVSGHQRYEAHKVAGLDSIHAVVAQVSDENLETVMGVENGPRMDMHPLDEGLNFKASRLQGVNLAEVALRYGRSEAFIAQRISLLGLSDKLRKKFKEGGFSLSVALVLARIPSSQIQEAVAKDCQDRDGFISASASEVSGHWEEQYARNLAEAPFDLRAEGLCPKAGSCIGCPKRTSQSPLLFPEVGKKDDYCTDAACWSAKVDAQSAATVKAAKEAGKQVVQGEAFEKFFAYGGEGRNLVELDKVCHEHPKRLPWRKVLAGKQFKAVVAVEPGTGKVREFAPLEAAREALKAALPKKAVEKESKAEASARALRKAQIEKAALEQGTISEAILRLGKVGTKKGSISGALLDAVLDFHLGRLNFDGNRKACRILGLEPKEHKTHYGTSKDYSGPLRSWAKALKGDEKAGAVLLLEGVELAAFGFNSAFGKTCAALGVNLGECKKAAKEAREKVKKEREAARAKRKAGK